MVKVLIVYCVTTQTALMKSIQKNVSCHNLQIDLLDIDTWQLHSIFGQTLPHKWYGRVVRVKSNNVLLCGLNRLIHHFCDKIFLKSQFKKYDIIDFHYYSSLFFPLIPLVKLLGKKVKITLWGSDMLRATEREKIYQQKGYELADKIQVATPFMFDALRSDFASVEDKTVVLPFGNQSLDTYIKHANDQIDDSFLPHRDKNKMMVVCGYNGAAGQRHIEMVDMLKGLPKEIQNQLYVVFPMTYGADTAYISKVKESLKDQFFLYDVLESRLTEKQIFDLRRLSDIVINIQITDAFSGSLQEHIFCENVLLVGDWLPYSVMRDAGIFYLTSSLNNLSSSFVNVFNNFEKYKDKCSDNKQLMYGLTSWTGLSDKWRNMYLSI